MLRPAPAPAPIEEKVSETSVEAAPEQVETVSDENPSPTAVEAPSEDVSENTDFEIGQNSEEFEIGGESESALEPAPKPEESDAKPEPATEPVLEPDQKQKELVSLGTRVIEVHEPILFGGNNADIKEESYNVLDQVLSAVAFYPDMC